MLMKQVTNENVVPAIVRAENLLAKRMPEPGVFIVAHEDNINHHYFVTTQVADGKKLAHCTCVAHEYHSTICKHIGAVVKYLREKAKAQVSH